LTTGTAVGNGVDEAIGTPHKPGIGLEPCAQPKRIRLIYKAHPIGQELV